MLLKYLGLKGFNNNVSLEFENEESNCIYNWQTNSNIYENLIHGNYYELSFKVKDTFKFYEKNKEKIFIDIKWVVIMPQNVNIKKEIK